MRVAYDFGLGHDGMSEIADVSVIVRKGRSGARRLGVVANRYARRPFRGPLSPFRPEVGRPLLVHCGHHKIGTLWFDNVLRAVCDEFALRYQKSTQSELLSSTDVFHQAHSNVSFDTVTNYRGTHIIRDLRDVVVSGYFYHLWTSEAWAHRREERWGGKTYQEHLRAVEQEAGLMIEMDRFVEMNLSNFTRWNYHDPNILELRYEDLLADETSGFKRVFRAYGFHEAAVDRAVEIALSFTFARVSKRSVGAVRKKSHLRSGKPGEWQQLFSEKHRSHFKERMGGALVALGYADDGDW